MQIHECSKSHESISVLEVVSVRVLLTYQPLPRARPLSLVLLAFQHAGLSTQVDPFKLLAKPPLGAYSHKAIPSDLERTHLIHQDQLCQASLIWHKYRKFNACQQFIATLQCKALDDTLAQACRTLPYERLMRIMAAHTRSLTCHTLHIVNLVAPASASPRLSLPLLLRRSDSVNSFSHRSWEWR